MPRLADRQLALSAYSRRAAAALARSTRGTEIAPRIVAPYEAMSAAERAVHFTEVTGLDALTTRGFDRADFDLWRGALAEAAAARAQLVTRTVLAPDPVDPKERSQYELVYRGMKVSKGADADGTDEPVVFTAVFWPGGPADPYRSATRSLPESGTLGVANGASSGASAGEVWPSGSWPGAWNSGIVFLSAVIEDNGDLEQRKEELAFLLAFAESEASEEQQPRSHGRASARARGRARPLYVQLLHDLYRHKYRDTRFEVIVASDNFAFDFLRKFRDELFPDVPVVFCGVNFFRDEMLAGRRLFTGAAEEFDAAMTVDILLKLHPNTRELFVLNDADLTGQAWTNAIRAQIAGRHPDLKVIYAEPMTKAQAIERVRGLPADAVVLLGVFLRDTGGEYVAAPDFARRLSAASPVPIYGLLDLYIGHGIVGGEMIDGHHQLGSRHCLQPAAASCPAKPGGGGVSHAGCRAGRARRGLGLGLLVAWPLGLVASWPCGLVADQPMPVWRGRVPTRGASPQARRAEVRATQRATADNRVGTVSLSDCRPSSCM